MMSVLIPLWVVWINQRTISQISGGPELSIFFDIFPVGASPLTKFSVIIGWQIEVSDITSVIVITSIFDQVFSDLGCVGFDFVDVIQIVGLIIFDIIGILVEITKFVCHTNEAGFENPIHIFLFGHQIIYHDKEQIVEFGAQLIDKNVILQCC